MNDRAIEREAVLWAWKAIYGDEPLDERRLEHILSDVLTGVELTSVVRVAIAYVESARNHVDTILELETNLATATEDLVSLRTVAAYYRIADYNLRRIGNAASAECYRKAAEALDRVLGASPGDCDGAGGGA